MISIRSKITQAVLGYFMLHEDAELYVNEISRRLGLDDGNLSRKLRELERVGLFKSRERGNERYYSLNDSFPLLKEYRRIILKTVGIEKTLQDALRRLPGLERAYLFGSYAANRMDPASDIDLLVVGNHDTVDLRRQIAEIEKSIDREINTISMSQAEYQRRLKSDPLVRSIEKAKKIRLIG